MASSCVWRIWSTARLRLANTRVLPSSAALGAPTPRHTSTSTSRKSSSARLVRCIAFDMIYQPAANFKRALVCFWSSVQSKRRLQHDCEWLPSERNSPELLRPARALSPAEQSLLHHCAGPVGQQQRPRRQSQGALPPRRSHVDYAHALDCVLMGGARSGRLDAAPGRGRRSSDHGWREPAAARRRARISPLRVHHDFKQRSCTVRRRVDGASQRAARPFDSLL